MLNLNASQDCMILNAIVRKIIRFKNPKKSLINRAKPCPPGLDVDAVYLLQELV